MLAALAVILLVAWLLGFIDLCDPMRPFTNLFYHVSYILGFVFGIPGSFVPV